MKKKIKEHVTLYWLILMRIKRRLLWGVLPKEQDAAYAAKKL
jgi:hypothetical protein